MKRAKTSRSPAPGQDCTEHVLVSGSSSCGLCESCDPRGFSLRTSLLSALEEPMLCSMAWKKQATPRGRAWWVLVMSARHIDEIEPGSSHGDWPTPSVNEQGENLDSWEARRQRELAKGYNGNGIGRRLDMEVLREARKNCSDPAGGSAGAARTSGVPGTESTRTIATVPTSTPSQSREPGRTSLRSAGPLDPESSSTSGKSLAWCTPTQAMLGGPVERENCASHHKGAGHVGNELLRQTGNKGRLNHRWVAQLMGFPSDWLDGIDAPRSKPSVTRSSRKSSK